MYVCCTCKRKVNIWWEYFSENFREIMDLIISQLDVLEDTVIKQRAEENGAWKIESCSIIYFIHKELDLNNK